MSRAWTCGRCGKQDATDARRGPVPKLCDPCKLIVNRPPETPAVPWLPPVRDPFNSTPGTAPVLLTPHPGVIKERGTVDPLDIPVTDREPLGPGPLELQLTAELAAMSMINPTAKTQSLLALQLARAADQLDPGDIKMMLTVGKELRSLLDGLNKAPRGGGDDDDESKPFGAVRAEIQHPPAV